jgi:hypothetical protein
MRTHRPQPGYTAPKEPSAQPGRSAARPDRANGAGPTNSARPHATKVHPNLTALARMLGRQTARDASSKGGRDDWVSLN